MTAPDVSELSDRALELRLGREHRQAQVLQERVVAASGRANKAKARWADTKDEMRRRARLHMVEHGPHTLLPPGGNKPGSVCGGTENPHGDCFKHGRNNR